MRKFDYSFLNNGMLPANLVNLTVNIAELKTMAGVRKEEYTQIFTELEAVARVQSIKSSNAIEGIVTSDERIAAIVNQNSAPLNHNEAEIAGYSCLLYTSHKTLERIIVRIAFLLLYAASDNCLSQLELFLSLIHIFSSWGLVVIMR